MVTEEETIPGSEEVAVPTPEESTPETPATEVAESTAEPGPPPRHPFYDRVKAMHPDREFSSDDDILSAADEKMTDHEEYRNRSEEANQQVIDALLAEPVFARVLEDISAGASAVEALALHFSPQDLEDAAKASNPDKWAENKATREKRRSDNLAFEETIRNNVAESEKTIKKWSEDKGLTPEQTSKFIGIINDALTPVFHGKTTEDFLDKMYKAMNYAEDIANAEETGKVQGLNANIETKTGKAKVGDGLPSITSQGSAPKPSAPAPEPGPLDDVLEREAKNKF